MMKQYGTIPFVRENGKIKVVLITSTNGYWIFPKGKYEEDLGKFGTAELEAEEEAGVKGRLLKKNAYRTKVTIKSGERVQLTLYPQEVTTICETWQEDDRRERKIVTLKEARRMMDSNALISCLDRFARDFLED